MKLQSDHEKQKKFYSDKMNYISEQIVEFSKGRKSNFNRPKVSDSPIEF